MIGLKLIRVPLFLTFGFNKETPPKKKQKKGKCVLLRNLGPVKPSLSRPAGMSLASAAATQASKTEAAWLRDSSVSWAFFGGVRV